MRSIVAAVKLSGFLLASLALIVYQTVFLAINKGPASLAFPRLYHNICRHLLGVRIELDGTIDWSPNVVYVSNHIGYADIQVLGSLFKACFVAKREIKDWPLFGRLGSMGQTIYISRNPADAARETKAMLDRLDGGLPLIIFPEGTSTNGSHVLPFKSSFFQILLNKNIKIQPVTISILSVDGKPAVNQAVRDLYAWYGDMTLTPHLWAFFKGKGAVVKVTVQPPLDAAAYSSRKLLCADAHDRVARGLDVKELDLLADAA